MINNNNNNYLGFITTTGNPVKDSIIGGIFGLADSLQSKGDYYVQSNYLGRGRADVGLGYAPNTNYRDPYKLYSPLMAYFNRNKDTSYDFPTGGNKDNRLVNGILGRLSGMGGNLGTWAQNKWNEHAVGKGNTVGDMNVRIWDNKDYNLA